MVSPESCAMLTAHLKGCNGSQSFNCSLSLRFSSFYVPFFFGLTTSVQQVLISA